ncbi:DNA helicase, partial [Tanacetum coccineum]
IHNTGSSTSLGGRNAHGNSKVSLTTGEATYSSCIGGRLSLNVRQTTTVSNSNFIHDNGEAACSRGIRGRPSVNVRQIATVCTSNFIHDNDVRNTGPSILRDRRNTRANPEVSLTTGEATYSRGIGGCRLVNVCEATTVCGSNFIHNNDALNTSPSTLRGGRNIRVNPRASLTTAKATCSSGISRRRLVRHRPSTRSPTVGSSSAIGAGTSYTYNDFGEFDQRCRHCGTFVWYGERLKGHSQNQRSEYHLCCGRGAKINESINADQGPYVFKVSGQIYHWIGSLCPPLGEAPRFLQLYIYESDNQVENRIRHFGGIHNSDLDPHMVEGLIHFLDAYNEQEESQCLPTTDTSSIQYDLIFRGGRLFQQYVIGVFCVVEQNQLDFIRKKQNDIRADYLSWLYDSISRGERDGYEVGGRIILPMSFTGGPR